MAPDSENLKEEISHLTDSTQPRVEDEFGQLIQRYVELYPQIEKFKSIATDDAGDFSQWSIAKTDPEKFKQWREENYEAVSECSELVEKLEMLFSQIGIKIGEDIDPMDWDKMESTVGRDLAQMYQDLSYVGAMSRSEVKEITEEDQDVISQFRSKFGL